MQTVNNQRTRLRTLISIHIQRTLLHQSPYCIALIAMLQAVETWKHGIVHRPISNRVNRASATKTIDTGSIPGRVKPKTIKLVFTASLLDVQQLKGECEASTVCDRQVGRWQPDSKGTFTVLRPKATK